MGLPTPNGRGLLLPRLEELLLSYQWSRIAVGYRIRDNFGDNALDAWVVFSIAGLFVLVLLAASSLWLVAIIVALIAFSKVVEVLLSCLNIVFIATTPERGIRHAHRSLALVLLNVVTLVQAFAAADRWLALTWPQTFTFLADHGSLKNADQFLYLSWTTITTLGNSYIAASTWSQALVVSEVISGLLMLTVIVGCLITLVQPKLRVPD